MIIIKYPKDNRLERQYILKEIFEQFLGVDAMYEEHNLPQYKIILPNDNSIIFPDAFFSRYIDDQSYLQQSAIPKKVEFISNQFTSGLSVPVVYGDNALVVNADSISCGMDIFASAYFMLTRWEEFVSKEQDQHDRMPAEASLAFKHGFLMRPVVNEYVEMLWNMLTYLGYDQPRTERQYTFYLSHDVDEAYFYYQAGWKKIIRYAAASILKRKSISVFSSTLWNGLKYKLGLNYNDPYDTYDIIMHLNKQNCLTSAFYFITDKTDLQKDSNYCMSDPAIMSLLEKIYQNKHEIGLHPSYRTYKDSAQLALEYDILQQSCRSLGIDQKQFGGRQHYLRWSPEATLSAWEKAGLSYDSTLSYADHVGFRCGTCYEYTGFDFLARKSLNLVIRPLIVMDCTLISSRYMAKGFTDEALSIVKELKAQCVKYNGMMSLLWHNSFFADNPSKSYPFYCQLISELAYV